MDPIEALSRSREEFQSRLEQVEDRHWDLPTPCSEWTVHDLVNHVMLGNRMSVELLDGATGDEVIAGLGDDLVSGRDGVVVDFAEVADQMHTRFAASGGLDGTVSHPMGVIPRRQFVGFRIGDYLTHAWDLARAIGADESLDSDVVALAWDDLQPMRPLISESGMFGDGPSGEVSEDAPLQTRYLDLTGRRP